MNPHLTHVPRRRPASATASRLAPAHRFARAVAAFTLVELLVVIGIIALLISILLPVVNKVREQGNTVKCMSNLRSIYIAVASYAAENKGSLPYGFMWEKVTQPVFDSGQWQTFPDSAGSPAKFMNWASMLSRYMGGKAKEAPLAGNYNLAPYYYSNLYSQVLRCPSVDASFSQTITYSPLMTAFTHWYEEMKGTSTTNVRPLTAPARLSDLYSDNTIMWDSPAWIKLKADNPGEYITPGYIQGGYGAAGYTFIDGGQLVASNPPDYRFRDKFLDPYMGPGNIPIDPLLAQNCPIYIPATDGPEPPYFHLSNKDVPNPQIQYGSSGVPRYRHNRDTGCNALVADGSVRTFVIKRDIRKGGGKFFNDPTIVESDWLRRYIMIKYPG